MNPDFDVDELDFPTGEDLITGACAPCKQGRHLDCRSLGSIEDPETIWPYFPPEDPLSPDSPEPTSSPRSDWVCGCLGMARAKRDLARHGEDQD